MEDTLDVIKEGMCGFLYAGVYDGHAGAEAADYLKDHMFKCFQRILEEDDRCVSLNEPEQCSTDQRIPGTNDCPSEFTAKLDAAFAELDAALCEHLRENYDETVAREAGSTATVVLVRPGNMVVCANVGDSRAVLGRKGQAIALSNEHRVYGRGGAVVAEIERVQKSGAWIDDGRVFGVVGVSRAFGDWEWKIDGLERTLKEGVESGMYLADFIESVEIKESPIITRPDVAKLDLDEDDEVLVVATDGLWDVMTSAQVVSMARLEFSRGRTAQEVADMLVQKAIERKSQDNVGAVVVDLKGAEGWAAAKATKKSAGEKLLGKLFGN
ncbi:unnamed protein product [Pedinophyceae sp. YPF-701]|nr:unnamed protein product [Pedinophyceae sp. YPF-701]